MEILSGTYQTLEINDQKLNICGISDPAQMIYTDTDFGWTDQLEALKEVFPKYAGSRYDFGETTMIVSRGLTRETPAIPRIFNRPELVSGSHSEEVPPAPADIPELQN